MTTTVMQTAFSAGEISPELYGEVDLAKTHSAATTLRNMIVNYRGGAMSRGGLALVGRCKQSVSGTGPPRPVPFVFSITQGITLEFGDQYLRFIFQGGYVLENPVSITGASKSNPCVIGVVGEPFANGDWVFGSGIGGMTELNGNTYIVAGVAPNTFTLEDLNGNPVDSSAFTAYTSGGSFSRLYTISTPYAAIDLPYLKWSQSADTMSLTCSNPVTGTEYPPYDLARLSAIDWTLQETDFDPVISPPASVSAASNTQAPSSGINATFAYVVTAVDRLGNESIASQIATCHGADILVEAGTNTVTWTFVQGAAFYNVYRAPPSVDGQDGSPTPVPDGSIYGFVGSANGTQFADNNSTVDLSQSPPVHANPFAPGQILAVDITSGGSGLDAVTYEITTTEGIDFIGTPLVIAGSLGAMPIINNGQLFQPGDSIAFNGAGFASGAVEFGSTNPSPGDTITLNGVVWTFVSAVTGSNQTMIAGALVGTLNALVSNLSASSNPALTVASYAVDVNNQNLLVTYKTAGTMGNTYTLAASRASVSGANLTGGSGSGTAGSAAVGNIAFTSNPTNSQTIILNGVTWTFVTSGATGSETNIGISLSATLTALASNLTASSNADITVANYSAAAAQIDIIYKTVGSVGNSYTLGAGTSGATPSGPTLTGGSNSATVPTATLDIGPTSGTYPGVVSYFQQRRFYANSLNDPDTFWGSKTGLYSNFDTSTPSQATDAITASPWTEQVDGIQWLISMPGGLIAMTGSRAWQIVGQGSYSLNVQPITPSTVQAQPQAFNGCSATIMPIIIDYEVLYVQAIGNSAVYDLSYNFFTSIYTGVDLTLLSSHLFLYRQIVQWAWAREPYKVIWCTCNDGIALSLTYLKEQQIYGWARHDTIGLIVGCAGIPEPPVNATYMVVQRFPPYAPEGIYTMERLDDRLWQSIEDTFAVDSAVSNPMLSPTTALFAGSNSGTGVTFRATASIFTAASVGQIIRMSGGIAKITGFSSGTTVIGDWVLAASNGAAGFPYAASGSWTIAIPVTNLNAPHLAGMTLAGLADGIPLAGLVAAPVTGLVTLSFAASNVKVGLPFQVQMQTPYMNGQTAIQGARKIVPAATVRVAGSASFQTGTNQIDGAAQNPQQIAPTWVNMATANLQNATGGQSPPATYSSPAGETVTQLWTGDIRVVGAGAEWNSKGQVAVQQLLPLPLEVTGIFPEMLPGDIPEVTYSQKQQGEQAPQGPGRWMLKTGARL